MFILKKPRVAIFAEIIKIATMFIEAILKTRKKLEELESTYHRAVYIYIS